MKQQFQPKYERETRSARHKYQFKCKKCGAIYEATWSKGLCTTCRKKLAHKKYGKKYHKSHNPYGHYANGVTTRENGDWLGASWHTYAIYGSHPIKNRMAVEAYNDLKRRYFTGSF